ncbi:MAG: penicillin-binding protein [Sulfobacillus acidophilus]|uniref:Penicillin-binding protein n=1 Tax=Sulfobacillus acidophilus TaxID=53633 RepID=A0A2T2WMP8_9FIRM|nr:MAG: penicillin-binding protein [Sulfobacillus acidophilus]
MTTKQIEAAVTRFIEQYMEAFLVPGVAVAIVQGSQVLVCRGFGVRRVGESRLVTEDTLFPIASASKAFTTTAVGILVDEGRLSWDQPVREYFPQLQLSDPLASQMLTLRDMACHRTGLPRHDLIWYKSPFSQAEQIRRIRYLELSHPFRSVWQYQNLMYMAMGHIMTEQAGQPWHEFIRKRIFEPLRMESSNFFIDESERHGDYVFPHLEEDGCVRAIPFYRDPEPVADGSINTNARDVARWLLLNLNGGAYDGSVIVSREQLANLMTPHMVVPGWPRLKEQPLCTYGLGWFIESYRGSLMIHHDGAIDGFSAAVALLPDQGVGIAILTNADTGSYFKEALRNFIADLFLKLDSPDWAESLLTLYVKERRSARAKTTRPNLARVLGTHPSHTLSDYAGLYEHPAYGLVDVSPLSHGLKIHYHAFQFNAAHYHYDTFAMRPDDSTWLQFMGPAWSPLITFSSGASGLVETLSMWLEPDLNRPIVFWRVS